MLRKFFPRDKNYVLEQAQFSVQHALLQYLVDYVKVDYLLKSNPLGIADDTAKKIQEHNDAEYSHLQEFYINLAGVFRFKFYADNQLEFIFDGANDFEKYSEEWSKIFKTWTKEFCRHESFNRAILELTVFYPEDYTPQMSGLRLSAFISKVFDVKIDPLKGIVKKSVA